MTSPPAVGASHAGALLALLLSVCFAGRRKLSLSRNVKCEVCSGSGSQSGKRYTCSVCRGSGMQVRASHCPPAAACALTSVARCSRTVDDTPLVFEAQRSQAGRSWLSMRETVLRQNLIGAVHTGMLFVILLGANAVATVPPTIKLPLQLPALRNRTMLLCICAQVTRFLAHLPNQPC